MSSFRRQMKKSITTNRKKKISNSDKNGEEMNENKHFVHGCILIQIKAAKKLPDMDSWVSKLVNRNDVTDAFIDITIGTAKLIKSTVINNDLNPVWNEFYRVEVCHLGNAITFSVRDKDHTRSEYIGSVDILLSTLIREETVEGWYPILKANGSQRAKAELNLELTYVPRAKMTPLYEVNSSYFPVRNNCIVTLYQDAHSLDIKEMPHFNMMDPPRQPKSCWKDLQSAFLNAKHLICISGWGFFPQLQLLRGSCLLYTSDAADE